MVLDPLQDKWPTPYVYHDPATFLRAVSNARECMVFVDESGEMIGRFNEEMQWLATRARHYGHVSHFLTQRATQLAATVRTQCSHAFVFRSSATDARILADEFACPQLAASCALPIGGYLYVGADGRVTRGDLFGKTRDFPQGSSDLAPVQTQGVVDESDSTTLGGDSPDGNRGGRDALAPLSNGGER